jgi:hypothetical protein
MKTTLARAATVIGILFGLSCALQPHRQPLAFAPRADVQITSSPNTSVLIYSSVPSQFALRGQELRVRSDTVRATTPVQLEAYLDAGEIHIAADGDVPLNVEATIAHSPATHATATGRHIVLDAGGSGVRSLR